MKDSWYRRVMIVVVLVAISLATTVDSLAQMRAITESGDVVLLFPNGTWRYLNSSDGGGMGRDEWGRGDDQVNIDAGATGKRFGLLVDSGRLFFEVNDGKLKDVQIYNDLGDVVYSYRGGVRRIPYNWVVQYDTGTSKRLRKLGPYTFKHDWRNGRLEQIGAYSIEYRFHDERVERIGRYTIRYDFSTGRLSEVGNIRIKYNFFTDGVEEISGSEPGVRLYLLSD